MISGRRSGTSPAFTRDFAGSEKFPNLFDRVPSTGIMFEEPYGLRGIALVVECSRGSKVADNVADAVDLTTMCAEVREQHLLKGRRQFSRGSPVGGRSEEPSYVKIEMGLQTVPAVNDRRWLGCKTRENFQRLPLAIRIPALRTFRLGEVNVCE
jgi:hypothetical protein